MNVLLLQLPVPNNPATNVPLAAGYLKAYAEAHGLAGRVQIEMLPRALADYAGDAALVEAITARAPDVLGMSLYTWNSERSLALAARVKAHLPNLIVVGGGPECQPDNDWLLHHSGLDIAVIGEGEQTFVALVEALLADGGPKTEDGGEVADHRPWTMDDGVIAKVRTSASDRSVVDSRWSMVDGPSSTNSLSPQLLVSLSTTPGLAFRNAAGQIVITPPRPALSDLQGVPSPYLAGGLEISGGILMVEVSRWCPYRCSFCLYGRNMGPKLGERYFGLDRLLAEIDWGRAHGATSVHFIEANLNLVPVFWPLMAALAELNADGALALYAELRGEHLGEPQVAALRRAGLRVAEVGLQTANPAALRAVLRRTDLQKWAAGTRRLYAHGVEVLLDVILGLPEDDAAGVQQTLDFLQAEELGPYDVFTLQVLPGTAVRAQAAERGYRYQPYPPYYVLQTDRLNYAELRTLRRTLKEGANLDPDDIEGAPEPDLRALGDVSLPRRRGGGRGPQRRNWSIVHRPSSIVHRRWSLYHLLTVSPCQSPISAHTSLRTTWPLAQADHTWLAAACADNPHCLFDVYLTCDAAPEPMAIAAWRNDLPHTPGYLDRVAVYAQPALDAEYVRINPRVWLVIPWDAQVEPAEFAGIAQIIWHYDLAPNEEPPLGAWRAAGGAGIFVPVATAAQAHQWSAAIGVRVWYGC